MQHAVDMTMCAVSQMFATSADAALACPLPQHEITMHQTAHALRWTYCSVAPSKRSDVVADKALRSSSLASAPRDKGPRGDGGSVASTALRSTHDKDKGSKDRAERGSKSSSLLGIRKDKGGLKAATAGSPGHDKGRRGARAGAVDARSPPNRANRAGAGTSACSTHPLTGTPLHIPLPWYRFPFGCVGFNSA